MSAVPSRDQRQPRCAGYPLRQPLSQSFMMSEKRVCIKATQAQPPWWVLCRGLSKTRTKYLHQPPKGGRCCSPESGPCPELGNDTEFSHLIGLRQEKPGDHWGRYRPLSLSSQRTRAPFKSFDELLLLERLLVMFRWQRGPEAAGLTPQKAARGGQAGGERPSCNHINCTKRTRTAVVNGSLPA